MSGYIGTQPVPQATQTRDSFTATSGQTSFATGGYTPNFLDVYLNGVKLSAADYTASNGSDVVLASGAATGDILEVVAFTTFTPASIPVGTPSIDDNGNATALTIDSSENVMIGTAVASGFQSSSSATGTIAYSGGAIASNVSGDAPAYFNRLSSDGTIINLRKDGTTVGSIGSTAGVISYINLDPRSGGTGVGATNTDSVIPVTGTGANADASKDLGITSSRWRDLYLSGGIYLGGVGSANKLEDYEEGTFTPNLANCTIVTAAGKYTKVGQQVFIKFQFRWNSFTGSTNTITGLPFTSDDYGIESMGFSVYANSGFGNPPTDKGYLNAFVSRNGSSINFTWQPNTVNANFSSTGNIYVAGVYNT